MEWKAFPTKQIKTETDTNILSHFGCGFRLYELIRISVVCKCLETADSFTDSDLPLHAFVFVYVKVT